MNNTLLIIGDPAGNHTLAALRKYPAESITVWESPSNHYTLKQLSDKINVVSDLDTLSDMHFDVVIGNPPYSETSSESTNNKSLDSVFFDVGVKISDITKMIIRAKHFTDPRSTFRRNLFQSGKVSKISYLDSKEFKIYQEIITCIVTYDVNHNGPTVVEYAGDVVKEEYLNKDSLVFLTSPHKKEIPYEDSLAVRWVRGKIARNTIDHNPDGFSVIEASGKKEAIISKTSTGEQVGHNQYGIVMNVVNHLGKTGPVRIKQYDACLSTGMLALITDTEEEAKVLYDFFYSEDGKNLIKSIKTSTVNSRQMFSYIQDPLK